MRPFDRARRSLLGTAAAVAVAGAAVAAPPFDLKALSVLLARRTSGSARFTEERFVAGIDGPLRASGVLRFEPPDRFVRQTLEPLAETMAVQGNIVTLTRGTRTRQLSLDAAPELGALVAALRGTLTGDLAALAQHFTVRLDGSAARWTLVLLPSDARLAAQVRELQISGQNDMLRSVALWLAGGDRSLMLIEPMSEPLRDPLSGPASAPLREPLQPAPKTR